MNSKSKHALPDVKSVFLESIELPVADRRGFIKSACQGDELTERNVLELLGFFEHDSDSILDTQQIRCALSHQKDAPTGFSTDVLIHRGAENEVVGRYMLMGIDSEDAWGTIYRAIQTNPIRREVAVKVLRHDHAGDAVEQIKTASCTAATLRHPTIASIFDGGTNQRYGPFLVMEVVDGLPIIDYCQQHRVPFVSRLRLFLEVCRSLEFVHQTRCIFRDIRPDNVRIVEREQAAAIKILNFGVAISLDEDAKELIHSSESRTEYDLPVYKAPEQLQVPDSQLTGACDIYALGVLLFELLTGQAPFTDRQLGSLEYAERLRYLCSVSPDAASLHVSPEQYGRLGANSRAGRWSLRAVLRDNVDCIVAKCLAKAPSDRYQDVTRLAEDVRRVIEGKPASVAKETLRSRLRYWFLRSSR